MSVEKSLDRKLAAIHADPSGCKEFIIADAKDADMGFSIGAPGKSPERHDGEVRLCVDDNGIGVPEKDRERIWTVFERLHPHHVFPGTGVELAIVAKAAARMGGRYGVEARPRGGSTFWVSLRDAPGEAVA